MPMCPRCGVVCRVPELTSDERAEVAKVHRVHGPLHAAKRLRGAGASLKDAKAVSLHLTLRPTQCHRCNNTLVGDVEVVCVRCRSLNFDW